MSYVDNYALNDDQWKSMFREIVFWFFTILARYRLSSPMLRAPLKFLVDWSAEILDRLLCCLGRTVPHAVWLTPSPFHIFYVTVVLYSTNATMRTNLIIKTDVKWRWDWSDCAIAPNGRETVSFRIYDGIASAKKLSYTIRLLKINHFDSNNRPRYWDTTHYGSNNNTRMLYSK